MKTGVGLACFQVFQGIEQLLTKKKNWLLFHHEAQLTSKIHNAKNHMLDTPLLCLPRPTLAIEQ